MQSASGVDVLKKVLVDPSTRVSPRARLLVQLLTPAFVTTQYSREKRISRDSQSHSPHCMKTPHLNMQIPAAVITNLHPCLLLNPSTFHHLSIFSLGPSPTSRVTMPQSIIKALDPLPDHWVSPRLFPPLPSIALETPTDNFVHGFAVAVLLLWSP